MERHGLRIVEGVYFVAPLETGSYYLVSDVDARIDKLEATLQSCRKVLETELLAARKTAELCQLVLEEVDRSLLER